VICSCTHDTSSAAGDRPGGRRGVASTGVLDPIDSSATALARRVAAEYTEMPGLKLTSAQAARLFGIEPELCSDALRWLIAEGWLRYGSDRRYYVAGNLERAKRLPR